VPGSGKSFGLVNASDLRASWDAAQKKQAEDYLTDWHILGPFPAKVNGRDGLSLDTAVEAELTMRADGSVPPSTPAIPSTAATLRWRPARANRRGQVDLGKLLGKVEWGRRVWVCEIESSEACQTTLRCGSDDGIQIWLNGAIVHRNEVGRAYRPDSDVVTVRLRAGRNRILVKIDNYHGGWGFGVAISSTKNSD